MKFLKGTLSFIWEISKIVIIALLIVIPIRYFIFQPFFVKGQSMEPNFHNGDYLIVDELSYRFSAPERGEVIVFNYPNNPSQRYIKRIIGLPEETIKIEDKKVNILSNDYEFILNESMYLSEFVQTPGNITVSLGENEYFVLGDNRDASFDSRKWGVLPEEDIIGRVIFRAWPAKALAKIEIPNY
ncbi:signal peptidase I [Candidatus Parcubacteria bacterium]|nr:signal peptidase I [Candidatus Parcubacteria bacterium]